MGFFSRFNSPKVPRWAFQTGWADFVVGLREEAQRYGLRVDDAHIAAGNVPLPETAALEAWDLRPLATGCRDREPYEWAAAIRESLFDAFGRTGDVELVDAPPPSARAPRAEVLPRATVRPSHMPPRSVLRDRLRLQLFGTGYLDATRLDRTTTALRPFGDAWFVLVEDLGGGETTVRWADLEAAGIDRDDAFAIARANALVQMAPHLRWETLQMPGALCELAVSNAFYLSAVMLDVHARLAPATPIVACALTWHHWVFASLEPGATRATLAAIRELVARLAQGVAVQASEWIGTSLWWWPVGGEPEVFTVDGALPVGLAALLE